MDYWSIAVARGCLCLTQSFLSQVMNSVLQIWSPATRNLPLSCAAKRISISWTVKAFRQFVFNSTLSQFILRLAIHRAYSCIFHPCDLLPHFPPLQFCPCRIFHSCILSRPRFDLKYGPDVNLYASVPIPSFIFV